MVHLGHSHTACLVVCTLDVFLRSTAMFVHRFARHRFQIALQQPLAHKLHWTFGPWCGDCCTFGGDDTANFHNHRCHDVYKHLCWIGDGCFDTKLVGSYHVERARQDEQHRPGSERNRCSNHTMVHACSHPLTDADRAMHDMPIAHPPTLVAGLCITDVMCHTLFCQMAHPSLCTMPHMPSA